MNINASLFIQCIVFLTFASFVMKFIWPPLISAIDERRQKIAEGLAAAEKANLNQKKSEEDSKIIIDEAKSKASEIIVAAEKQAHEIIEKSKTEAKNENHRLLSLGKEQIELERQQISNALRKQLITLSVMGAEKIVSKEMNETVHAKLLEEFIAQL